MLGALTSARTLYRIEVRLAGVLIHPRSECCFGYIRTSHKT